MIDDLADGYFLPVLHMRRNTFRHEQCYDTKVSVL